MTTLSLIHNDYHFDSDMYWIWWSACHCASRCLVAQAEPFTEVLRSEDNLSCRLLTDAGSDIWDRFGGIMGIIADDWKYICLFFGRYRYTNYIWWDHQANMTLKCWSWNASWVMCSAGKLKEPDHSMSLRKYEQDQRQFGIWLDGKAPIVWTLAGFSLVLSSTWNESNTPQLNQFPNGDVWGIQIPSLIYLL